MALARIMEQKDKRLLLDNTAEKLNQFLHSTFYLFKPLFKESIYLYTFESKLS